MSDLNNLAVQLREIASDTQRFRDDVRGVGQRAGRLERDAVELRSSGVDVRRLVELLHAAGLESGAAAGAIESLRLQMRRFADSMTLGSSVQASRFTPTSALAEVLIVAEAMRLFLAPGAVALSPQTVIDDAEPSVAAQLLDLAQEQLARTDDLVSLREAVETTDTLPDDRR